MSTIISQTTYSYDKAHNRTKRVRNSVETNYTYNNLNQLTEINEGERRVVFLYDDNGNRIQRTEGEAVDTYGYDYENRLVSLQKGNTRYAYTYDYRTRRVERVEGSTATKVVFSGGTSVQEYEGGNKTVEYVRGSDMGGGIGGILYSLRNGQPSYNHYNNRGDVVAKTDGNQAATYQAEYEAFGTRTQEVGQTQDRQKANTKEEDPTGLLNEGFRYRDLETGSFITRDPLGFKEGPNLYTYVHQNPWTKFDPEGLEPVRDQAGSIEQFTHAMDTSKNKVGLQTGQAAGNALKYLGTNKLVFHGLIPHVDPAATPPFNKSTARYVYTENSGWLDMVHFVFYAGLAYQLKENGLRNPIGEAVRKGYIQEALDSRHSKYSYEDLPTDKIGAIFGAKVFDPKSSKSLSEQIKDFVKTHKPADPKTAPNWNAMPSHDDGKSAPTWINRTTKPMFTRPSTNTSTSLPAPSPKPVPSAAPAPSQRPEVKKPDGA